MVFEKKILDMYKKMMYTRCDDAGRAYYFSADDFPGLLKEDYRFTSSVGHEMKGYLYHYGQPISGRLIIFDHGMGGGHRSYMKEIEMLCRHGYLVLAYDHTGCMESGGETTNGLSQSLRDLNDCINSIKKDSRLSGLDISVIGHSWGGYSCLNIAALHPEISHIVVLCGFVSVELMINSFFSGPLKGYRKAVMKLEAETNPDFVGYNAVETLSKTDARVLLIYSDNDKLCRMNPHYTTLKAALSEKKNIRFLLKSGKGHNPNYTEDAVKYLGEYAAIVQRKIKKKELETEKQKSGFVASFDWNRMTAQDETVWNEIFKTLAE